MDKPMQKPPLRIVAQRENEAVPTPTKTALHNLRLSQDGGIEYQIESKDGPGNWKWLCSPVIVRALTRDNDGKNWGRLIEITDPDGKIHRWAMPAALLAGHNELYRAVLLDRGAQLASGMSAAKALHRYLSATINFEGAPLPRAMAATRLGWHDSKFVLPDHAIGSDLGSGVVYQSTSQIVAGVRKRGTLDDWRQQIASPVKNNSRIMLAISAALAGPLLRPLKIQGGGLHFRGGSSVGKTTALQVAGSVWGGPHESSGQHGYIQSWQATANGIEGLAAAHCDLPLCLDEIGHVKAEDASRVAYQLASGIGRTRATKTGATASRFEWRTFLLSSGEISLEDKISESRFGSQRLMAGQSVRLIDLQADAGKGLGIFDDVPESYRRKAAESEKDLGAKFAQHLSKASQKSFGTAGPAFVEALINKIEIATKLGEAIIAQFVRDNAEGADGQVQRVAQTFGLCAAAGEIASQFGILSWHTGAARQAASICFNSWLNLRGTTGSSEINDAIAVLQKTIEKDVCRFQSWDACQAPRDRLGFVRVDGDDTIYHFLPSVWHDLTSQYDKQYVKRELIARSILKPGGDGRADTKVRVRAESNPIRVYTISGNALNSEREGSDVPTS